MTNASKAPAGSLPQRKRKFFTYRRVGSWVISIGRFILIFGICFIILYPFLKKILTSFMSPSDLVDPTVQYIARDPSIHFYKEAIRALDLKESVPNTVLLALSTAIIQMATCTLAGYGFARFSTKFSAIVFGLVIFTLLVPPQLILTPLYLQFRYLSLPFLPFKLVDNVAPFIILSLTCLGIKNGLYIYMMRQFFRGMPVELEEAAYVDGYGVFRTFFYIMLPNAIPMMVTIFLFALSWQWTDTMYVDVFTPTFTTLSRAVLNNIATINADLVISNATRTTAVLIVIAPLVIIYLFCQKSFVQSVERSGLVG